MKKVYPPEDQLYGLVEDGATVSMLAKWYRTSRPEVVDWLAHYELEILSPSERSQGKIRMESEGRMYPTVLIIEELQRPSKKRLLEYLEDAVSVEDIAKQRGVSVQTVESWYKDARINQSKGRRHTKRTHKPTPVMPPKYELEDLFLVANLKVITIAELYETSRHWVEKWLKHYNIFKRVTTFSLNKPTKEQLEELYINQRMNVADILAQYKMGETTFYKLVDAYGINRLPLPSVAKPPKSTLEHFYLVEGKTAEQIGIYYGTSENVVRHWLFDDDIRRPGPFVRVRIPEKEELKRLYLEQKMTGSQIAKWFSVSEARVRKWIKKYKLQRGQPKEIPAPPRKELVQRYVIENHTIDQMVVFYGVSQTTFSKWTRDYKIYKKPRKEVQHAG